MSDQDQRRGPERLGREDSAVLAPGAVLLVLVSPLALLAAMAALVLVMGQVKRCWREVAAVAAALLAAMVLAIELGTGNVLRVHYGGYAAAFRGSGSWLSALMQTVPVGVPLGVLAGALAAGYLERSARGAEWHPAERRRLAVTAAREDRRVLALGPGPRDGAHVLGVFAGGDLHSWVTGDWVLPPAGKYPAMGIFGESGSGKTVTLLRMAEIAGSQGRKMIFCDFKGSDPDLPAAIVAAYLHGAGPDARCVIWPEQAIDLWRGSGEEIAGRLIHIQHFTEPYYQSVAETAVRLACLAPGFEPPRSSRDFMRRLTPQFLTRVYENTDKAADVMALVGSVFGSSQNLAGVRLRYSGFCQALGPQLDGGVSFSDADLLVFTAPVLAQPSDAMAACRMILSDFGSYCLSRKLREEEVTIVVDEFSAVSGASSLVISLAERIRDVGGQVIVSVQNFEGLGADEDERVRLRDALVPGGLIIHRMAAPEKLVLTAGKQRELDRAWKYDGEGGSLRMAPHAKADPDEVRQLRTGEAFVINGGRALRTRVLMPAIPEPVRGQATAVIERARCQALDCPAGHDVELYEDEDIGKDPPW